MPGSVARRVADSRPFLVVAAAWFAIMASANLATPLYAVYRQRFGFSSAVLTAVFAVYALVLVPSLLVFGPLSDRLGRRRVIAGGMVLAMAGLALFAAARSTGWLFAARVTQGLAVGMVSGAANAALLDLEPWPEERRAALLAALAQAGGSAAGPVVAGLLAQWAPAPRALCFLAALAVIGVALLGVLRVLGPARPPGGGRPGGRAGIHRPGVPAEIRARFAPVALTAGAVWAVAALFLSVVPSYAGSLLDSRNLALLGAIAAIMLAASCGAQIVSQRRGIAPARAQPWGLLLLAAALGALVLAFPARSLALLVGGAVLGGAGHGLAFLGAQDAMNRLAPAARRGEVTAAFYTCVYLSVAVPIIGVGLLGLEASLFHAVAAFAAVTGATALLTAGWHVAGGPRRAAA
jgi:MFS family permease